MGMASGILSAELNARAARRSAVSAFAIAAVAGAALVAAPAMARQGVAEPPTIVSFDPGSDGVMPQAALGAERSNDLRGGGDVEPATPIAAQIKSIAPKGAIRNAYAALEFESVWSRVDADGLRRWDKAAAFFDAARDAAPDHAAPDMVDAHALRQRLFEAHSNPLSLLEAARLELALSGAILAHAEAVHGGAIEPASVAANIDMARPLLDFTSALRQLHDSQDMRATVDSFAPQSEDYAELKAAYARLREAEARGVWAEDIAVAGSLRPMDRGDAVAMLRARLVALGDLPAEQVISHDPETGEMLLDGILQRAVMDFQERHGLVADGVVGANTLAELNVPPRERARQLAVNMERARWLNRDLGQRHIVVNIADFRVTLFDDGQPIYESAVVVGKAVKHQTPEFSDEMTHVVVNPHWNVPYSIATKELLPIFQVNPGEIYRRNMEVIFPGRGQVDPMAVDWRNLTVNDFPFQLRQRPGPSNALGQVKFIFPNHHSVYLHDTPAKSLFSRPVRAFSHGCVRVAKPVELAEILLGRQHSNPLDYYYRLVHQRSESFVELDRPVPVHIIYRTAWKDARGALQFRRDVYGRDEGVSRALEAAGAHI